MEKTLADIKPSNYTKGVIDIWRAWNMTECEVCDRVFSNGDAAYNEDETNNFLCVSCFEKAKVNKAIPLETIVFQALQFGAPAEVGYTQESRIFMSNIHKVDFRGVSKQTKNGNTVLNFSVCYSPHGSTVEAWTTYQIELPY